MVNLRCERFGPFDIEELREELENLEFEYMMDLAPSKPPTAPRDMEVIDRFTRQFSQRTSLALPSDPTESCVFVFLDAAFVRDYDKGTQLPFYQEIRSKHPNQLRKVTITYAEVIGGTHMDKRLVVSHRWMDPNQPDPDGEERGAMCAPPRRSKPKPKVTRAACGDGAPLPEHILFDLSEGMLREGTPSKTSLSSSSFSRRENRRRSRMRYLTATEAAT